MGAWGHQPFENDAAHDWLSEAEADVGAIEGAFERAREASYLDVDDGSSAVAAAAIVAAAADGEMSALPERAGALAGGLTVDASLRASAVTALDVVLGESSELRSLWDGDAKWRATIESVRKRLETPTVAPSK